jgi:ethanolamine utilization protein EutQ (cupin superfamily)
MTGIRHLPAAEFTWGSLGAESAEQDSIAEVVTHAASPETGGIPGIGAGITELRALETVYPVTFDEVCYVIDGELELGDGETSFVARAGDIFTVAYGTQLRLSVPGHCRVFYAATPSNWSELRPAGLQKLAAEASA